MFNSIDISGSGMAMSKRWMEVTSNNIANINTTRGTDGNPYRRQTVVLEERTKFESFLDREVGNGVQIKEIAQDKTEDLIYNPEHPDAMKNGYVRMPKINLTAEMTNMLAAQRTYEANASAFSANKKMMEKELEIGK
ncbi:MULTISPECIES: flagellar basal body rod protein FlgC [Bacillus cereus group]|uniref:Flagellar basal-body rod protein FlgC n=2 Tax=Bacillus cereus group TaxID=86661 RepID=A0A9X6SSE6_BACCE|nr:MULTISPECIES: flagellar basal body rod protein FlgC [Bacillus cereus group]MDA1674900.1 flagellar basal body rod protein FlgC [Bacillus cereus group sp. TH152-1LC]PDZ94272.1 flagellar basal body rod protein FlgC [Bacillus cereus]PFJ31017.1 flagellar basal body rod protein FlgC [Bacillus thuringiensis]PGP12821.1 flagellar basal body rod protein FlgC [Bacillus cereus]